MHDIKPRIPVRWKFCAPDRKEQSLLDQLRMGCLLLKERLFRFKLHEDRLCPHCKVPENIEHCVFDCRWKSSASVAIRSKLKLLPSEVIPFDLSSLLDSSVYSKLIVKCMKKQLSISVHSSE